MIGWDVAIAANVAVAGGTLVLAYFTWRLARQTHNAVDEAKIQARISAEALSVANRQADIAERQVAVSQQQADVTNDSVLGAIQPMLVACTVTNSSREVINLGNRQFDLPHGSVLCANEASAWLISIPLRNVGPGVAVVVSLGLDSGFESGWSGSMLASIVANDESTRFNFVIPHGDNKGDPIRATLDAGDLNLVVGYDDIAGSHFRTRACVHRPSPGTSAWHIRQVMLYRGNADEPFARSGPSDPA